MGKIFVKTVNRIEKILVKKAVNKVIETGSHFGHTGFPYIRLFEKKISEYFGRKMLAVNSGTDALLLTLKAMNIRKGDEIVVAAFGFISTASTIVWLGATPKFVDISAEDYAIDSQRLEGAISNKTKGIIITHLFGQPSIHLENILRIAKKHNLFVIEDNAQSFGSKILMSDNKWYFTGTLGNVGCLSFSSTKPFAAPGNGGGILFNQNEKNYDEVSRMSFYGARTHFFDYPTIGINSKIHEIQAAALVAKFPFINFWMQHRASLATTYTNELEGIKTLICPKSHSNTKRTWYRYVVRTQNRDELYQFLKKEFRYKPKLLPLIHYPVPLPLLTAFRVFDYDATEFPIAQKISTEIISLPIMNFIYSVEIKEICEKIRDFLK